MGDQRWVRCPPSAAHPPSEERSRPAAARPPLLEPMGPATGSLDRAGLRRPRSSWPCRRETPRRSVAPSCSPGAGEKTAVLNPFLPVVPRPWARNELVTRPDLPANTVSRSAHDSAHQTGLAAPGHGMAGNRTRRQDTDAPGVMRSSAAGPARNNTSFLTGPLSQHADDHPPIVGPPLDGVVGCDRSLLAVADHVDLVQWQPMVFV